MHEALVVLDAVALAGLAGWIGVATTTARAWDLHPVAEDAAAPPDPRAWPSVAVLVPARNEASALPHTLPTLLAQDYAGEWRIVLVDDRSADGTADVAASFASPRLLLVDGAALPEGWVGKMWALDQAAMAAAEPTYYLLTDGDIRHAPSSLRRLVAEAETGGLALVSRMARLNCSSAAERLLIPPFLFFFNLLYPMRRVNCPRRRTAASAGGCVLVRRESLGRAGGFAAIRDRVIDDVSLARAVKRLGEPIALAVSRTDVTSVRRHDLAGVWRMVRRTAFTELRGSWLLLGLTVALLVLLFPLPPVLAVTGVALVAGSPGDAAAILLLGASGLTVSAMTLVYLPTVRFFGLAWPWALTLPAAGCLYGGMTVDSALRRGNAAW